MAGLNLVARKLMQHGGRCSVIERRAIKVRHCGPMADGVCHFLSPVEVPFRTHLLIKQPHGLFKLLLDVGSHRQVRVIGVIALQPRVECIFKPGLLKALQELDARIIFCGSPCGLRMLLPTRVAAGAAQSQRQRRPDAATERAGEPTSTMAADREAGDGCGAQMQAEARRHTSPKNLKAPTLFFCFWRK